jgi:hypothetical protein
MPEAEPDHIRKRDISVQGKLLAWLAIEIAQRDTISKHIITAEDSHS